jgi:hypothetical protein
VLYLFPCGLIGAFNLSLLALSASLPRQIATGGVLYIVLLIFIPMV